jgi:hypothetical protein
MKEKCLMSNVDNPYLVTFLIRKPILEWCLAPSTDPKKDMYLEEIRREDIFSCSKYTNYSNLNDQHNRREERPI